MEDILNLESISTLRSILEAQVKYLTKLTKNNVYAVVNKDGEIDKLLKENDKYAKDFNYTFYIRSKFIDNYSYRAFSIHHDIDIYPLYLRINSSLKDDISMELHSEGFRNLGLSQDIPIDSIGIRNEEEFIKVIKLMLTSKKIHHVISSLVSLSK